MTQRIGCGALLIALLLALFVVDVAIAGKSHFVPGPLGDLLARGSILPIAILIVVLAATAELIQLVRSSGARPFAGFAYVMVAIFVLTPWFSAAGWLGTGVAQVEGLYWPTVWAAVAVVGSGLLTIWRRDATGAMRDTGATFLVIFYLGMMGSFSLQLRCGRDTLQHEGASVLLMVLLITKASDIGAYFAGSWFGRHKLIPSISPGKTIEGSIGGILAAAGVSILMTLANPIVAATVNHTTAAGMRAAINGVLADATHGLGVQLAPGGLPTAVRALIFGVLLSLAAQFGDLIESCFKRDVGVKDSGQVIPRFGGILDLIDSPLWALPIAWLLLTGVWNVI